MNKINNSDISSLFEGGGEMGERIRNYDWSKTSIGSIESWPQSLKTIVRIMMTSRQPIWIGWGPELIKLYNDPYKAIVGGKHPEALGKPASVVWSDIWKDIEPMLKQVMEKNEGTFVESQLLIMERNGFPEETYYTFSYNPVPSEDGTVGGMFCTNSDDTQTVIGERQLNLLRSLASYGTTSQSLDAACELIIKSFEENGRDITSAGLYLVNETTKTLQLKNQTGFSNKGIILPDSLDEKTLTDWPIFEALKINHPIIIPAKAFSDKLKETVVLSFGQEGLKSGVLVAGINELREFDKSYQSFISLVAAQVSSNIANAQKYEDEKKRIKALEKIDQAKTIFFSNISHEFRTPLTLMLSPLEELLNDSTSGITKKNKEHLETTHRNAMRLLKLVNNLLDFSRLLSGRQTANFSLHDISSYTKFLAGNFRMLIEKAGLEFIIKADEFIQPVYIDKTMWEKIVFNLLSNAVKYTHRGKISVTVSASKQNVILTVEDTGVGIPQEELPKMFERFHRVQNSGGRSHEGTGIGLSLIKELIKLHGGTISVTSKLGEGSRFTVTIPFGKDHLLAEHITKEEKPYFDIDNFLIEEASSLTFKEDQTEENLLSNEKGTLLLVDDNADMRNHIKSLLEKKYNVLTAANGMEALHKIKENKVLLIISDIMMPIMDGFQLVKEVKGDIRLNHIPIILISARAGEEAQVEGFDSGADDYLIKPFSSKELIARVGAQINMIGKREQDAANIANVVSQSPVAMTMLLGKELVIKIANDKALELWGKKLEDVINLPVMHAFPELVQQGFGKILDDVYSTGLPFIASEMPVTLVRHGKPETLYINFIYQPLQDKNKKTEGLIGIGVDVTEQVRSRKIIENSDARFKAAIKAVNGTLWTNNAKGEMQGEQIGWSDLTGQTLEEYQGYGWSKVVHPDDVQPTLDAWNEAVRDRKVFLYQHRVKTKEGKYKSFSVQAIPVTESDGSIREWVGVHTHI